MDVIGHVLVDVVGQLDETERVPEVLLDPPRQVARIDRQAMPANTRAGRKTHVPERFRRRRVDCPPHIDPEIASEHRQFVDERDVHMAERVLQQLDELGLGSRTDSHRGVNDRREETVDSFERFVVDAADHLRRVLQVEAGVAGIDPLRRVAAEELPSRQPGPLLQDRDEQLGGGAWIRGALEHHARPRPKVPGELASRGLDVGQVRQTVGQWRRDADDRDVEPGKVRRIVGRQVPGCERCCEFVVVDVADVALARGQRLHPGR